MTSAIRYILLILAVTGLLTAGATMAAKPDREPTLAELRPKAGALAQQALHGQGDEVWEAMRPFYRHPELGTEPDVVALLRPLLSKAADPAAVERALSLVNAIGLRRLLHAPWPGHPPLEWRKAQVAIPPPEASPLPPPEAATTTAAPPPLSAKQARELKKTLKVFAKRKVKYADCGYEAGGFMGGQECEGWAMDEVLDPLVAAHMVDREVFARGGELDLPTCADGHSKTWSLPQLYLDELNSPQARTALLQLLAVRVARFLAEPGIWDGSRGAKFIHNFLAVSLTPVCRARGEANSDRACLLTWLRWTAAHASDSEVQQVAHRNAFAELLASSRDVLDWQYLVLDGATMFCRQDLPPVWFWAARNLALDVRGPEDWNSYDTFSELGDWRRILHPVAWRGLVAADL